LEHTCNTAKSTVNFFLGHQCNILRLYFGLQRMT
jgi:hypothetical protein